MGNVPASCKKDEICPLRHPDACFMGTDGPQADSNGHVFCCIASHLQQHVTYHGPTE